MAEELNSAKNSVFDNVTYLKNYQPPKYFIDKTELIFFLESEKTLVTSRLSFRRNDYFSDKSPLRLHGESLILHSILIDDESLFDSDYSISDDELVIRNTPDNFTLETTVEINPKKNLSLEGLYLSDGIFCTQCEAEGFRHITYYLDRPDVMSVFSTKIIANKKEFPILLSNGNLIDSGEDANGKHWVKWSDPFKKPSYLFALVAGDLVSLNDEFITSSGKKVDLKIFSEKKDIDKCSHAMWSLKNSMKWDEEVYGREYDLDLYMIVAVDFFNSGAMENKGLNIFNTACILSHQSTQTDKEFQRVEAVIAHEYFHNWSGNRVTCRDWFQLSLKEGFTVFRDACFSADMNSPTVKRIEDVSLLRSAQFAEDSGPMSHPIRPESYIEIRNFYTLTIYEKGAEVIRMIHTILGPKEFRKGTDLYFKKHDGNAVTCEDFVVSIEQATNSDLKQFRRWYSQSGTPEIKIIEKWNSDESTYSITIEQACPKTPNQENKLPFVIPIRIAFVGSQGLLPFSLVKEGSTKPSKVEHILLLTEKTQSWDFFNLIEKPVPSLLRNFSAPVKLEFAYTSSDLLLLIQNDNDGYIRWDAAKRFIISVIKKCIDNEDYINDEQIKKDIEDYSNILRGIVNLSLSDDSWNQEYDAALLSEILRLPNYHYIMEELIDIDVKRIFEIRNYLEKLILENLRDLFLYLYKGLSKQLSLMGGYQADSQQIALRSLKNLSLNMLLRDSEEINISLAVNQFDKANNMTDQLSALSALVNCLFPSAEKVISEKLDIFYKQWSHESLVVNKWLTLQAMSERPEVLSKIKALKNHEAYDDTNPNKIRALVGGFCNQNISQFHDPNGEGYLFLANEVIRLDGFNSQLASRIMTPLTKWQRFSGLHKDAMHDALVLISNKKNLSPDVFEIVSKSLSADN